MKVDTFHLDEIGRGWVGLHNPRDRWNGWACPWFTYETIQSIAMSMDACIEEVGLVFDIDGSVWETDSSVAHTRLPEMEIDGVTYFSTVGWAWHAESDWAEQAN